MMDAQVIILPVISMYIACGMYFRTNTLLETILIRDIFLAFTIILEIITVQTTTFSKTNVVRSYHNLKSLS